MRRFISMLVLTTVIVTFSTMVGCVEDTQQSQGTDTVSAASQAASQDAESKEEAESAVGSIADNTVLGEYNIEIKSCRLAKDYSGKDVAIITYGFTNNDEDAQSFSFAVKDTVYQDGVGLNEAYLLDDDADYSADNQLKEVKQGVSLDVEVAYELNDTTTDLEVEVTELISFDDDKITKVFKIA